MQGEIIVLDAGSQPGASKIQTADDCCNACRQNSQVSMRFQGLYALALACLSYFTAPALACPDAGSGVLLKQTNSFCAV